MMMKQDNWMPFYVGDYLRDTGHLTACEHGAYLLLLMHAWTHDGVLQNDEVRLRNIAKLSVKDWNRFSVTLKAFFYVDGDTLRHRRIDRELAKFKARSEKRSAAGKASAAARKAQQKANTRSTGVEVVLQQKATEEEEEEEEEKKEDTLRVSKKAEEPGPVAPLPPPKPDPNGTRLAADWHPGAEGIEFAKKQGLNPTVALASFRDYWHAKPGKDGRKIDWQATWRNWCRRDKNARPTLFESPRAEDWNQF